MSLDVGTRLGSLEITALLGKGGMGEVYRALDTKLKREVAIKILPDEFSRDADRVRRFQREAEVLASLNHPNIAAIYDLQEANGSWFLILELIEGETLADRIARGPIPVEESLEIARHICEGLEAAHEKGVIHRDLKPANVKITPDGTVKVLDFGLAKIADEQEEARLRDSPTLTAGATRAGVILGTAAYMSPEQAQGKRLDKRTDIWSFGVVLYEMLTGKQPFRGETAADTVAGILKETPDLDRVPANVRPLLRKCLEKDRKQRLRDIGDVELLLDQVPGVPEVRKPLPWIAAAVLASAFALIAGIGWWRATRPVSRPLARISAELTALQPGRYRLDAETTLASGQPGTHIALSPDGTYLAAAVLDSDGQVRLATHRLDERTFVPLRGAENPGSPFFSPDGQWIAFFAAGKLRKIPVQGGSPITVYNNTAPFASGSWGDDGNIIAALGGSRGGLSRVPSAGGDATPVTELTPGEQGHAWPQVLPGSKAVLFTAYTNEGSGDSRIDVLSFGTHERRTLVQGGIMGRYLMTPGGAGYLVYVHQNILSAAPFDAGKLTIGAARAVLDDVSAITGSTLADFDFSRNGTFVYFSGKGEPERSIFWLDGTGQKQPLHSSPGFYNGLRFSPNGSHLVFAMGDVLGGQGLWIQESESKPSVRLTSFPGASHSPVWSPDGAHILFAVVIDRETGIYWIRSDGAGEPQLLTKAEGNLHPSALSPDGKWVVFMSGNPFTATDVSIAPFEGTPEHPRLGKIEPLLRARGFSMPAFSPDGHWLAYASGDNGRNEVYVQPFPGPGGKVVISTDGGGFPQWSPSGRELFFLSPDRRIMVAEYTVKGNSFSTAAPRLWSKQQILLNHRGGPYQPYALTPDGKRFAVVLYPDGTTEHQNPLHLTFLLNFFDDLGRRMATE